MLYLSLYLNCLLVLRAHRKKSKSDARMNDDRKTPVKGREIAGASAVQPNTDKKGYVVC
jgi:hypothetical protein